MNAPACSDRDTPLPAWRGPRVTLAVLLAVGGLDLVEPTRAEGPAVLTRSDAEAEAERLIETLSARLLTSPSATAVLEAWCAERGLAEDPRLVAVRVPGPDKAPTSEQRERLAIGAEEPVRYRRVRLVCGGQVLSEADNWYVPARLTPEMNTVLETTTTPFGRVVRSLRPTRRNLLMSIFWRPGEASLPGATDQLFAVSAVLSANGLPFSEVAETYTGAVLARGVAAAAKAMP